MNNKRALITGGSSPVCKTEMLKKTATEKHVAEDDYNGMLN